MLKRVLIAFALVAVAGCGTSTPAPGGSPTAAPATATAGPPTTAPSPTPDAASEYMVLASTVNREWKAIGTPQSVEKLSYPEQQQYAAAWFALENEIASGLTTVSIPAPMSNEVATMVAAVQKLQTLLQPSDNTVAYLPLTAFQPLNDQRNAAAAVRVRLGLPPLGKGDLI